MEKLSKLLNKAREVTGTYITLVENKNNTYTLKMCGGRITGKYDDIKKILEKLIKYPKEVKILIGWGDSRLNMKEIPNSAPVVKKYGRVIVAGTNEEYLHKLTKNFDKPVYIICYKNRVVINSYICPMIFLENDKYGTDLTGFVETYQKNVFKIRNYPPRLMIGKISEANEDLLLTRYNMKAINSKL